MTKARLTCEEDGLVLHFDYSGNIPADLFRRREPIYYNELVCIDSAIEPTECNPLGSGLGVYLPIRLRADITLLGPNYWAALTELLGEPIIAAIRRYDFDDRPRLDFDVTERDLDLIFAALGHRVPYLAII